MSRRAIYVSLAAAAMAGPAMAADPYYPQAPAGSPLYQPASIVTANLDIAGGIVSASGTSASGTGGYIQGIGRVNMPVHEGWNLQIDVMGLASSQYTFLDKNAVNLDHTNVGATAYLYQRNGANGWGPYISIEKRASEAAFWSKVIGWAFGPRIGPWEYHAYGQVGWLANAGNNGVGFGGQVGVQYWLDRNSMVGADVMFNNFNIGTYNANVWTGALTALHKFDMPLAAFAQARLDSYSGSSSATLATFMIGTRFYVNPGATDATADTETGPMWTTKLPLPIGL